MPDYFNTPLMAAIRAALAAFPAGAWLSRATQQAGYVLMPAVSADLVSVGHYAVLPDAAPWADVLAAQQTAVDQYELALVAAGFTVTALMPSNQPPRLWVRQTEVA